LEATGRVLGVLEKANYRAGDPFVLEPGDVLLCYTDGVTEARSPKGELFESERLGKALKRLADRDGASIVEGIREEVRAWTHDRSPNEDDITMVAVQRPVF
ncbi:MAG: PP2C family protein-serine/threonine phosphatase, partial [Planctomycetota bacterium]|nr:PP2C family protein-serine/threonine phosphatase [Planctomycetota bacterium]